MSVRYKTIWISDVHIGTGESKIDALQTFLRMCTADDIFLVGDILDTRQMLKKGRVDIKHFSLWPDLLRHRDSRIHYVVGNHDSALAALVGKSIGNVRFVSDFIHCLADGRRMLVTHGDIADKAVRTDISELKVDLVCMVYYFLLLCDNSLYKLRKRMGLPPASMVSFMKSRLSSWRAYRDRFVDFMAEHARSREVGGVICGHIHWPDIRQIGDVLYVNCGDWVEHCTAVVEHEDGSMHIVGVRSGALRVLSTLSAD